MFEAIENQIRKLRSIFWSEEDPEGRGFVVLADTYRQSGDLDQALELLEEGLERHPRDTSALLVLSRVQSAMGQGDRAVETLERILELDQDHVLALRDLGLRLEESGRVADAVPLMERAAALDPYDRELRDRLESLGREESEPEPVGEVLEETEVTVETEVPAETGADEETAGADLPPGDPPSPFPADDAEVGESVEDAEVYTRTMAEVYASQGHLSRAIEVYEHLLRESPGDEPILARIEVLRQRMAGGPEAGADGDETEDQAAHLAAPPHVEAGDSPFSWTEEAGPASEGAHAAGQEESGEGPEAAGPRVRDYFQGLLQWDRAVSEEETEVAGTESEESPAVPIGALAPDPVEALPVVPIDSLAPDLPAAPAEVLPLVPIASLAPDLPVVPVESLAPDPPAPTDEGDEGDEEDEFGSWLRDISR